ncbi:MAG: YitT family protein [Clostridiales bacterium]|nr:YitT family protein [Clostridiales bacterium]
MEEQEIIPSKIITDDEQLPPKITKESFAAASSSKQGRTMFWVKCVLYTLLSSFLIAFAAQTLIAPNNFTIGGISGIAILVSVATEGRVPQSLILFSLNLPLVVLAFFLVKKRFALLSAMNITTQTIWLFVFEQLFGDFKIQFPNEGGEKIFAAIAAGLCIGTAIALAFKVGGSTGGADILAVMIQRKVGAASIAWMLFGLNVTVIGSSFFFLNKDATDITIRLLPIMMSAFESYIESRTNESVTNGFQSAREFRIITDRPEAMAKALMKELSRGVTALPATGMYTKITHTMLLCVVSRRQVVTLKRIMKQVDPDSFAVMSNVSQVLGLGFYTDEM